MDSVYDLAIIGGGINGCGIARDAAGRGLSVFLCEMADLASGTSSRSTKLIHGGLRYLEHFDFRLVRESLIEREVLWRIAPHIVRPMRFVLPHRSGLRPAWMLRVGLFFVRSPGRPAGPSRRRGCSISPATRQALHSSPVSSPQDSNIRTAGWTTRGWSFSTRATQPTAAQ